MTSEGATGYVHRTTEYNLAYRLGPITVVSPTTTSSTCCLLLDCSDRSLTGALDLCH